MVYFFNNKLYDSTTAIIQTDSKAFRYGELVFETMRFQNGKLLFYDLHFERLEKASNLLQIKFPKLFTAPILLKHIEKTIAKNNLTTARVRVTVFKGNGGLFEVDEDAFNVLIETYTLENEMYIWNENGLVLCNYTTYKKNLDALSNYKTGNHLIYSLAAQYAKQKKCNEAIVFNTNNTIADTTISNIYIIKNKIIYTPPITDGCIDGIFRKYILQHSNSIEEKAITAEDVLNADEVFVTNATKGIQWVKTIEDKVYNNAITQKLFIQISKDLQLES